MNEKEKSEKIQANRNAFEGMKGRQPSSDQELKEWLATDEGKMATMFESTGLSAHGDESSGGLPLIQILRDAFEGRKGRQPNSDQELKEWLATGEGKEAESSLNSRFSPKSGSLNDRFLQVERPRRRSANAAAFSLAMRCRTVAPASYQPGCCSRSSRPKA